MAETLETKEDIVEQFKLHANDVGGTGVQIARLTARINWLTSHLKNNPKDFATRRGLQLMVGQRRRLMNYYLRKNSVDAYKQLLATLGLRK
jgi:small subunit ribosomal protein S15